MIECEMPQQQSAEGTKPARVFLIDSMSHIFRAFYAPLANRAAPLQTSKGQVTQAVFIFTNMLRKLLQDEKPEYIAAVFDTMVPGVLGTYDLPDLVASLAPRPVQLVNMRSPVGNVLFLREVQSEYAYTHAAYSAIGSAGRLRLGRRREGESIAAAYPDLRQSHNEGERLSAIRWL